jgi:RNA polymerase sigma-70 factor (ECF subfamily)
VPELNELPERLDSVLRVIYLVFNEGYSASSGEALLQQDLSDEAIRLARLLGAVAARPGGGRPAGLMLLQASRQQARIDAQGNWWCWNSRTAACGTGSIEEGCELVRQALQSRAFGPIPFRRRLLPCMPKRRRLKRRTGGDRRAL